MVKDDKGDVWLTPKEAAIKLSLSVGRIYQIKDSLTHRKGNTPQSHVYFLERTLFDDYMNKQICFNGFLHLGFKLLVSLIFGISPTPKRGML